MQIDCIEWSKYRQPQGYGLTRLNGKLMLAHRVAWIKAFGPIPEGTNVLHRCDNPPCVNPKHLFLGSQADNIKDCYDKGRISKASRNAGTSHPASKITEQTAIRIKMLCGVMSCRKVAKVLGMNYQGVHDIMVGKNWKHVTANTCYNF